MSGNTINDLTDKKYSRIYAQSYKLRHLFCISSHSEAIDLDSYFNTVLKSRQIRLLSKFSIMENEYVKKK